MFRRVIALFVLSAAALATGSVGCSSLGPCDTSDNSNPAELYTQGEVRDGTYMSSPWTGPLLAFPGGKRYTLEHKLGCVPRSIQIWTSFSDVGATAESASSIAPSAGNMSLVQEVTDEHIIIKNDTCSDYFVLVTAGPECVEPGAERSAGDGDAGQ